MTQEELDIVIDKDEKWLLQEPGGERADLYCEDLHGLTLQGVDMSYALMYGVILRGANLNATHFSNADLREADLCMCNMFQAYFENADLSGANMRGGDLREAHMKSSNLDSANILHARLSGAYDLPYIPISCPEVGGFKAWKKAQDKIISLYIPPDAIRTSATSRKCRSDKAEVLGIYDTEGNLLPDSEIASDWDPAFIYKVNSTAYATKFDLDRWAECSDGIHFFTGFYEAVNYK